MRCNHPWPAALLMALLGTASADAHFLFVRILPAAEGGRFSEVYFSDQADAGAVDRAELHGGTGAAARQRRLAPPGGHGRHVHREPEAQPDGQLRLRQRHHCGHPGTLAGRRRVREISAEQSATSTNYQA